MHRTLRSALFLGFLTFPFVSACEEGDIAPTETDGKHVCEELAELCHEVGLAFGGELQVCHQTAEKMDGDVCLEIEPDCAPKCRAAQMELGGGGAGGEGHGGGAGESTDTH
jgi:hypothetical protein